MELQATDAPSDTLQRRYPVLEYRCDLPTLQECVKRTLRGCLEPSNETTTDSSEDDENEDQRKAARKQARDDLRAFRHKLATTIETTERQYRSRLRQLLICLLALGVGFTYVAFTTTSNFEFWKCCVDRARAASTDISNLNYEDIRGWLNNLSMRTSVGFSRFFRPWSHQFRIGNATEVSAASDASNRTVDEQKSHSEGKFQQIGGQNISSQVNNATAFTAPSGTVKQAVDGHLNIKNEEYNTENESSRRMDPYTTGEGKVAEMCFPSPTNLVAIAVLVASMGYISWYEVQFRMAKKLLEEVGGLCAKLERKGSEVTKRDIENIDGSKWRCAKWLAGEDED